jgi:hypothetical protein
MSSLPKNLQAIAMTTLIMAHQYMSAFLGTLLLDAEVHALWGI